MWLLLYCYFLYVELFERNRRKKRKERRSIQNVEAKLHGIFMYLLRILFFQDIKQMNGIHELILHAVVDQQNQQKKSNIQNRREK